MILQQMLYLYECMVSKKEVPTKEVLFQSQPPEKNAKNRIKSTQNPQEQKETVTLKDQQKIIKLLYVQVNINNSTLT